MAKQCKSDGCSNPVFSNLYCSWHQNQRTDAKRLASQAKVNAPRTGINKVSERKKKANANYETLARLYKIANPYCKALLEGCTRNTNDIHHTAGRGPYLTAISTFLPVCRSCHNKIEDMGREAYDLGFKVSRLK